MKAIRYRVLSASLIGVMLALLTGCLAAQPRYIIVTATLSPDTTVTPAEPQETPTPAPTATVSPSQIGPANFAPDVNPLTGLRVEDLAVLNRRPLLIKISDYPDVVRPQSGLSFADHVWEYIMEDKRITRYTAVYYSRAPEYTGSVRSARLIDIEQLMPMYDGILVLSGGSLVPAGSPAGSPPRILERLLGAPFADRVVSNQTGFYEPYLKRIYDVPRPGIETYHSLFAIPSAIWAWADQNGRNQRPDLTGLTFDPALPGDPIPATAATVDFPAYGPKHRWDYDEAGGHWLSTVDDVQSTDYLTGEPLAFDNVLIMGVEYYEADFIEDEPNQLFSLGLKMTGEGPAVLLRDGQRFEGLWQRNAGDDMIRLVDRDGHPIPFRPGTIWFSVYSTNFEPSTITFEP
ncbi:MAG: DUF3048 C-terminal domain-containing protein [Anaerolineae bacterium]|nr:DUF3048 C-terminal domain-containing protein [Anaerolineae bacterium]